MRLNSSIALALLSALIVTPVASGHDLLVDIYPAPGQVINQRSFEATLVFNNPLLVLEGETNAELSTKAIGTDNWVSHPVSLSDRTLTAQVVLTEIGDYDLRWKVVSSDGHPISGESTFSVMASAPKEQTDSPEPNLIQPNPTTSENNSEGSMVGFYVGLGMVALGAIFAPIGLMIRRRARKS